MHPAFALAPHFAHLNHGAFGAPPRAVLQVQAALRARMEAEPSKFLNATFEPEMRAAAGALADYLRTDVDGLVDRKRHHRCQRGAAPPDFAPGDEILITDQTYGAVANAAAYAGARGRGGAAGRPALPSGRADHDFIRF